VVEAVESSGAAGMRGKQGKLFPLRLLGIFGTIFKIKPNNVNAGLRAFLVNENPNDRTTVF